MPERDEGVLAHVENAERAIAHMCVALAHKTQGAGDARCKAGWRAREVRGCSPRREGRPRARRRGKREELVEGVGRGREEGPAVCRPAREWRNAADDGADLGVEDALALKVR